MKILAINPGMISTKVGIFSDEELLMHDHAAARGEMNARALIVFKHESKLGNARSAQLFDLVKIEKREGVDYSRQFGDYKVTINDKGLYSCEDIEIQKGITMTVFV